MDHGNSSSPRLNLHFRHAPCYLPRLVKKSERIVPRTISTADRASVASAPISPQSGHSLTHSGLHRAQCPVSPKDVRAVILTKSSEMPQDFEEPAAVRRRIRHWPALYTIYCILHAIYYRLYSMYYVLYTRYYILHTIYYILYNINYLL